MTIGYAGASQQAVVRTLLHYDVETLLDIRETPLSRKPGMSRKSLAVDVPAHGIRYDHIRALGTPRDIRHRRKVDKDFEAFRTAFVDYLLTQDDAMRDLVDRALRERCCLMCYEADPADCHRWFVAERAVELSGGALSIVHLEVMVE